MRERGGEHSDQSTTLKLVAAINHLDMAGMRVEAVIVNSTLPEGCELTVVHDASSYHLKVREGDLKFRGFDFPMIGRGTVHICELPTEVELGKLIAMPVLDVPGEATPQGSTLVKKSRRIRKRELAQKKRARQNAQADGAKQRFLANERLLKRSALVEQSAVRAQECVLTCSNCKIKQYSIEKRNDYERHVENCQGPKAPARKPSAMISEHVGRLKTTAEGEMSSSALPQRVVCFHSEEELQNDWGMEDCGSSVRVTRVAFTSENTALKVHITPGCTVLSINNTAVKSVADCVKCITSTTQYPVSVTYELQPPPLRERGFARRITRSAAQHLNQEQEAFLTFEWKKYNEKTTAAVLCQAMESAGQFQSREELWLDELQINKFLQKLYRDKKAEKGVLP